MIWTDWRWRWPATVLDDPRVINFWDDGKIAGRWYEANLTHRGAEVEWDAFFLYGPDASWVEAPPRVVTWGRTILANKDRLREGVTHYLDAQGPGAPSNSN
jgi:hypothetical protein